MSHLVFVLLSLPSSFVLLLSYILLLQILSYIVIIWASKINYSLKKLRNENILYLLIYLPCCHSLFLHEDTDFYLVSFSFSLKNFKVPCSAGLLVIISFSFCFHISSDNTFIVCFFKNIVYEYSQSCYIQKLMFYKVTENTELANTESLPLGEIQG